MDIFSTVLIFVAAFLFLNMVFGFIQRAAQQRQGVTSQAVDIRKVTSELAPLLDQPFDYLGVLPQTVDEKKRELLLSALISRKQEHQGEALRSLYQYLTLTDDPSERAAASLLIANNLLEENSILFPHW